MKKLIITAILVLAFTHLARAAEEPVNFRTLLVAQTPISPNQNTNWKFRLLNFSWTSNAFYSVGYLGLAHKFSDTLMLELNSGTTICGNCQNSALIRGDVWWQIKKTINFSTFVEYYFRHEKIGMLNDIRIPLKQYRIGFQNLDNFFPDDSDKNTYIFGPFAGIQFNKMTLLFHYRWHALPNVKDYLVDLTFLF